MWLESGRQKYITCTTEDNSSHRLYDNPVYFSFWWTMLNKLEKSKRLEHFYKGDKLCVFFNTNSARFIPPQNTLMMSLSSLVCHHFPGSRTVHLRRRPQGTEGLSALTLGLSVISLSVTFMQPSLDLIEPAPGLFFQGTPGSVGPEGLAGEPGKPGLPGLPGFGKPGPPVRALFHNERFGKEKKMHSRVNWIICLSSQGPPGDGRGGKVGCLLKLSDEMIDMLQL